MDSEKLSSHEQTPHRHPDLPGNPRGRLLLRRRYRYRPRYPNFEVRASLPTAILNAYVPSVQERLRAEDRIYAAVEADDPDAPRAAFHAFFASLSHDWHRRNDLADYEDYPDWDGIQPRRAQSGGVRMAANAVND